MPINYDEIIRKAEARRAALQAFSEALQGSEESMGHLAVAFAAAEQMKHARDLLDSEAKQLLGDDLVNSTMIYVERIHETHKLLDSPMHRGTYRERINALLEKVK